MPAACRGRPYGGSGRCETLVEAVDVCAEGGLQIERGVEQELDFQPIHRGQEELRFMRDLLVVEWPEVSGAGCFGEEFAHALQACAVAVCHELMCRMVRGGGLCGHGRIEGQQARILDVI